MSDQFGFLEGAKSFSESVKTGKQAGKVIGSSIEDVQKEAASVAQQKALERRRQIREAEVVKEAYARVSSNLPTYLGQYFTKQTQEYKKRLMDSVLGDNTAIKTTITEEQKEEQLVNSLSALGFVDPALFKKNQLTKQNLDYVIANYLKNDFIHKAEFMKVFVGDISNFQVKGDFREVFKRIPLTSSPGFIFQDNPVVMSHLNNSSATNGLHKALTGAAQKFRKTVRTVIFNDFEFHSVLFLIVYKFNNYLEKFTPLAKINLSSITDK